LLLLLLVFLFFVDMLLVRLLNVLLLGRL